MVKAFPWIFLTFPLSYSFPMLILIIRTAQNVALDGMSTLLTSTLLSWGSICHRTTFLNPYDQTSSFIHQAALLYQHLPVFELPNTLRQGPRPNIYSWAYHPYTIYFTFFHGVSFSSWSVGLYLFFLFFNYFIIKENFILF